MSGSGGDLSWLRPLRPDGNLSEDALGCHRGKFESLNPRNAQPGMTYAYVRREQGRIRSVGYDGYKVVGPDDPEHMGECFDPNFQAAGLDSAHAFGDVVMVKCPTPLVRERQQRRVERNEAMLGGATRDYLDRAAEVGGNYHSTGRPIRYKRSDHRIEHGKPSAD